jgi:hypothetical protein
VLEVRLVLAQQAEPQRFQLLQSEEVQAEVAELMEMVHRLQLAAEQAAVVLPRAHLEAMARQR